MRPQRWAVIESLFYAALDKEPEERSGYLAGACVDDPALLSEIESLLRYSDASLPGQVPRLGMEKIREDIKRCFEGALKLREPARSNFLQSACVGKSALFETVQELLKAHRDAFGFLGCDKVFSQLPPVFEAGNLVAERFRIIRFISRGGMGEVYEAYDERLSIMLALKTLRSEYASDCDALERFRREILVTRDFGHPNLCRVYDLVEHRLPRDATSSSAGIVTCLTMQLMRGDTLQQYLTNSGPLSPQAALPLIQQIAGAIEVLHTNGIIHRDLKPSNIMITRNGEGEFQAIVMDFGLAKPLANRDLFESRSDFRAGAPLYLAPELLKGEKPGIASDVYALGLIIDEMVTTSNAFVGDSVEEILYQKLWSQPKDPKERAPDLPDNWCRTIRRCLNRDPARRFSRVSDVVEELRVETQTPTTRFLPFLYRARVLCRARLELNPLSAILVKRSRVVSSTRILLLVLLTTVTGVAFAVGYVITRPLNVSVLIFDFENWTGNSTYDYLCKGITFETKRRLQALSGVDVKQYYGPHPRDASFKPESQFSIEGHLQTLKDTVRFSVDVTDNRRDKSVWMANFDKGIKNSLEMQTEIASGAVDAMQGATLFPGKDNSGSPLFSAIRKLPWIRDQGRGTKPTTSEAAWDAYMRGHALLEERTLSGARKAATEYEKALQEDPTFAFAYADLAATQLFFIQENYSPRLPLLTAADNYAKIAVATGPEFAESYTALAAVRQRYWDWSGAEQNYKRAIQLNPKFPRAHRWYAGLLIQFGRFDEGLREMRTSNALDPYDYSARLLLGTFLSYSGRPKEAADYLEKSLAEKDYAMGHEILGIVYAQLGLVAEHNRRAVMLNKALAEADLVAKEDRAASNTVGESAPMYALFHGLRGDRTEAYRYLAKLLAAARAGAVDPEDIACAYVALGDERAALEVLEQGVEAKDGLLYIKVDPFLEPLQKAPEWKELIARTGL